MMPYQKRRNKKKTRVIPILITALLIVLVIACLLFVRKSKRPVADLQTLSWSLILVNKDHPIPPNYKVELTELSNGEKVDTRIYPELQDLFDAARRDGLELFVSEGYRTEAEQQRLMDEKIEAYINDGFSEETADKMAKEYVAVPGTSEHQLGIAVDINADTSASSRDEVYDWLAQHAHEYGFIYRYPVGKTKITGINNEPWHYRYVGKDAAAEIYAEGLCLEEYLGQTTN